MRLLQRRVAAVGALLALVLVLAGTAGADGDPASDVLIGQDVFVPFPSPPRKTVASLNTAVAAVFAQRHRIKVAVVATRNDLGSVPSLFNKPNAYAKFLGLELATVYVGPLLIVMPAGFGVYDGGRSTAAENRVLGKLPRPGRSAGALTRDAANAVRKLMVARALRSKDIHPPTVFPQTAFVHAGETAKLTYLVLEDSERSSEVVRVFVGTNEAAVTKTPLRTATYAKAHSVKWSIPAEPASPSMKFCVVAVDGSGNKSDSACGAIKLAP
jgi:hypothetical protein